MHDVQVKDLVAQTNDQLSRQCDTLINDGTAFGHAMHRAYTELQQQVAKLTPDEKILSELPACDCVQSTISSASNDGES